MGDVSTLTTNCIEGERVRLRKGRNDDADGLVEIQTDARVRRFLGGTRPEHEVRALVESVGAATLLATAGCYIVAERESDAMLGTMVLSRRGPEQPGHVVEAGNELELTYVFRPAAWGNGYAAEAARALLHCAAAELPDQPVVVITQTANRASLRLAERLGFTRVGTFEQHNAEQTLATVWLSTFLAI
jgi:RimJ/RimL family protein N-acetyltransferase